MKVTENCEKLFKKKIFLLEFYFSRSDTYFLSKLSFLHAVSILIEFNSKEKHVNSNGKSLHRAEAYLYLCYESVSDIFIIRQFIRIRWLPKFFMMRSKKEHQRAGFFLLIHVKCVFIRNSFHICNKAKFANIPNWRFLHLAFCQDWSKASYRFFCWRVFHLRLMSKHKTKSKLSSKVSIYANAFIWLSYKFHLQSISSEKRDEVLCGFMKNDLQSITQKKITILIHKEEAFFFIFEEDCRVGRVV